MIDVLLIRACTCAFVCSALGAYYGNAYENLWMRVQKEPPNAKEVMEGYEVSVRVTMRKWAFVLTCSPTYRRALSRC